MINEQHPTKIAFVGDVHGQTAQMLHACVTAHNHGATHILQLGDFGIWDKDTEFLNTVNKYLQDNAMQLYFIDGNHENFPRLYAHPLAEDGTRSVRTNIHHLPRGFVFTWDDFTFMAMGGAYSIDRRFRTLNRDFWTEELITDNDIATARANAKGRVIDVLLTHDSPAGAPNSITDDLASQAKAAWFFGENHLEGCNEHRERLRLVAQAADPAFIAHGHYHKYMSGVYTQPSGKKTVVLGLDEGTAATFRYIWVTTIDELKVYRPKAQRLAERSA